MKYEACPKCRDRGADSRGDNLVIWPDDSAHCFSCGFHRNAPWRGPSVFNRINEEVKNAKGVLPFDFTREVPTFAWKWLLQYGLPYSYWQPSTGYSKATGRLILTCESSPGNVAFSIGRLVDPEKQGAKWYVWGDCHKSAVVLGEYLGLSVLVEDLISAHKVAQVAQTTPLFGTEVHPAVLYSLRNGSSDPVVLWLDDDQRGGSHRKATRLETLLNRPVSVVHTTKDPKALTVNEIKECLNPFLLP